MAKVFVGIAIAVMIATAVVGYLAHGNIVMLQDSLKKTKNELVNTKSTLRKVETDLKETTEKLTAALATVEDQKATIAKQKGEVDKATADLTKAMSDLEEKNKTLAALEAQMKEMETKLGPIKPEELVAKIKDLSDNNTKLQTEVAELKQVQETMNNRVRESEDKLTTANTEVKRYRDNVAKVGLTGKILAINPGWNFAVLSIGDKQGAAVGAVMIVMRGGEAIAKAKITSVEPATSIADIVPGSVRRGVTVQPGDTVLYEGQRK